MDTPYSPLRNLPEEFYGGPAFPPDRQITDEHRHVVFWAYSVNFAAIGLSKPALLLSVEGTPGNQSGG